MFTVVMFVTRKDDISLEEFKHHYETSHVPLVKFLTGDLFPASHKRRYLAELGGSRAATGFDALTEMTFSDHDSYVAFSAKLMEGENGAKVNADCAMFLDTTKFSMLLVGEEKETTRDS